MHIPVMLDEAIELLKVNEGKVYIDCTFGEGGHTLALLNRGAIVISIDRDFNTKIYADKIKKQFHDTFFWVNDSFSNILKIWEEKLSPLKVDGILFDLGFSSNQIEAHDRGFSFMYESNLDMRYNQNENTLTGLEVINSLPAEKLADIFYKYGEENNSRKIAKIICDARKIKKIKSCYELLEICKKGCKFYDNKHFATKIFQALRIYVNDEFTNIEKAINNSLNILTYYGRIVVITFHSLEDKIIKNKFNNKNIIQCSEKERKLNKRARSAKIRWKVNVKE